MKRDIITLIFEKGSKWKGELYPCFYKESERKLFEKKRARAPPYDKEKNINRAGVKPPPEHQK